MELQIKQMEKELSQSNFFLDFVPSWVTDFPLTHPS